MIVVDTNVMVRFVFGGDEAGEAARLYRRDPEWTAPGILMSELRNVLVGFARRGTVTLDQAVSMSDDAAVVLGRRIVNVPGSRVVATALECGLSAYDAEFVVLARMLAGPLATLDREILRGAADVAVPLGTDADLGGSA